MRNRNRRRHNRKNPSTRKRVLYLCLDIKARDRAKNNIYESPKVCCHNHRNKRGYCERRTVNGICVLCEKRKNDARRIKTTDKDIAGNINRSRECRIKRRHSRRLKLASLARKNSKETNSHIYKSPIPCSVCGTAGKRYYPSGTCCNCSSKTSSSDKKKEYDYVYYRNNSERIKIRGHEYYKKNKAMMAESCKNWALRNKEKVRAYKQNYKHKRRSWIEGGMTSMQFNEFKLKSEKICFYCDKDCTDSYHVDHIIPLSKGGDHLEYNLCIACPACNLAKNDIDPDIFVDRVISGD